MTIKLKDRRKPWQKSCVNFKFTMCGSMLRETEAALKRASRRDCTASKRNWRYTGMDRAPTYTIGELEKRGMALDTPLRFNPAPVAIAAE